MKVKSEYSHTVPGLFCFDLPFGIFLFIVFHAVVRDSLAANLPAVVRRRFSLLQGSDWRELLLNRWMVVCFSLLVGAASHLFWDGFTHSGGYFVQIAPVLRSNVVICDVLIPVFKVLQHGSSILGMLTIFIAVFFLPACGDAPDKPSTLYWLNIFLVSAGVVIVWVWINEGQISFGNAFVAAIAAFLFAIVLVSLIFVKKTETSV